MSSFEKTFLLVDALTQSEFKPVLAMNAKMMEEVGEMSTALLITEGHITHKELAEPLVGEVADVIQCALSVFIKATPNKTPQERLALFLQYFESKTNKWATVQQGEYNRMQEADGDIEGVEDTTCAEDEMAMITAEEHGMITHVPRMSAAREYMNQTGRHLTLEERMQENRLRDQREHHNSQLGGFE